MSAPPIQHSIRKNVAWSYVALVQRMLTGIFSFRLIYSSLDREEFGYWALLWSVFGYSVLLDFGFGVTVQKRVAQLSVSQSWEELNRSLSTIFFTYCGLAVVMATAGWFGADAWVKMVGVAPERQAQFADLFRLFLLGVATMFPLGVFAEILRGLQCIALLNRLEVGCSLLTFAGVVWATTTQQSFSTLLLISLLGTLGAPLLSVLFSFRLIRQLRLTPANFSKRELRSATSFSFVAYFIMISYVVMTKSDLLVISSLLTVATVAFYQPGAKLANLFNMFTKQLAHVLQPAAAQLYAQRDKAGVSRMLIGGIRYSALLSTPLYLATATFLDVLLRLLTGEKEPSETMLWVGQILLLWSYSFIITHNVYKRIALMGGHERRLLWIGIVEALTNVGLSVLAVYLLGGVIGVALGTLIPGLVFGWTVLWRWAAQEAGLTPLKLWQRTLLRTWRANLPLLLLLVALRILGWTQYDAGVLPVLASIAMSALVGVLLTWRYALEPSDRSFVLRKLGREAAVGA